MARRANPLSQWMRPKDVRTPCPEDCPNYGEGYCIDHKEVERSRAMGTAVVRIAGFIIPIGLLVLITVLGFLSQRIDEVEGKVTKHMHGSNEKLDQIHHSVMTLEFNMRKEMGDEFIDLEFEEDY